MERNNFLSARSLLGLSLGAYFLLSGIIGMVDYSSNIAQLSRSIDGLFGGGSSVYGLVVAIISIISGVILLLTPFGLLKAGVQTVFVTVLCILWIVSMMFSHFIDTRVFQPAALAWLHRFSIDLIILVSIWLLREHSSGK